MHVTFKCARFFWAQLVCHILSWFYPGTKCRQNTGKPTRLKLRGRRHDLNGTRVHSRMASCAFMCCETHQHCGMGFPETFKPTTGVSSISHPTMSGHSNNIKAAEFMSRSPSPGVRHIRGLRRFALFPLGAACCVRIYPG